MGIRRAFTNSTEFLLLKSAKSVVSFRIFDVNLRKHGSSKREVTMVTFVRTSVLQQLQGIDPLTSSQCSHKVEIPTVSRLTLIKIKKKGILFLKKCLVSL